TDSSSRCISYPDPLGVGAFGTRGITSAVSHRRIHRPQIHTRRYLRMALKHEGFSKVGRRGSLQNVGAMRAILMRCAEHKATWMRWANQVRMRFQCFWN